MMMSRSMIPAGLLARPQAVARLRTYSTKPQPDFDIGSLTPAKRTKKVSSAQLRKQRNKLAISSLKDIFESFTSSSTDDDEVFEIDPKPIYASPQKFMTLNQPLQQYVLDDLSTQLKKKWISLPADVKRFHYILSYDNYGPRESFPAIDSTQPPLDLPFKLHTISTSTPKPMTEVKKQQFNVDLRRLGEVRFKQSQRDSRMDPLSKAVLFIVAVLTILNFKRDSKVQSTGKIPVNGYEKSLEEKRKLEQEQLAQYSKSHPEPTTESGSQTADKKKWYFLWLR